MKITNMTYEIFRRAAHRWSIDNDVSLERVEHYGRDEILARLYSFPPGCCCCR